MRALAADARRAARVLSHAPTADKDRALLAAADAILAHAPAILEANRADLAAAGGAGATEAFLDRLRLDARRLEGIAAAIREVAALPDPVGRVTGSWSRPHGLSVKKVRIPLGVVLMVYEARPNVTAEAAALCVKSGNACILRPGSDALASSLALGAAFAEGLEAAGLPAAAAQVVPVADREATFELLALDDLIDLAIPRGGPGLIRAVAERSRVPVVKHYQGICHLFLDETAGEAEAIALAVNGKVQRPSACNATECLLVHRAAAERLLPGVGRALAGTASSCAATPPRSPSSPAPACPASRPPRPTTARSSSRRSWPSAWWPTSTARSAHIARHGSLHTEAILTNDLAAARRFEREVEASAVMINASTRFNDGGELGLGAEIGISTTKLHAFGPMGLEELTTQKYVVEGRGNVRTLREEPREW